MFIPLVMKNCTETGRRTNHDGTWLLQYQTNCKTCWKIGTCTLQKWKSWNVDQRRRNVMLRRALFILYCERFCHSLLMCQKWEDPELPQWNGLIFIKNWTQWRGVLEVLQSSSLNEKYSVKAHCHSSKEFQALRLYRLRGERVRSRWSLPARKRSPETIRFYPSLEV